MAYDFKIMPPAPESVSGPSALNQIELAINEIGDRQDAAEENMDQKLGEIESLANAAANSANQAHESAL